MKNWMFIIGATLAFSSSVIASSLECTNLDRKEIKRSVQCSTDFRCVLSVKMDQSAGQNILLNKLVRADRASLVFASSVQPELNVTVIRRGAQILLARVNVGDTQVAACQ